MGSTRIEKKYVSDMYADLPGIIESFQRLTFRDGAGYIEEELRQMFLDHGVEDVFGVRLLHKHFVLRDDERMIQHGHTALPWSSELCASLEADGSIHPSSWLFRDGAAYPYEFHYIPKSQGSSQQQLDVDSYLEFFTVYRQWLVKNKLSDVLGLFALQSEKREDGNGTMLEINLDDSRASVNFPTSSSGTDEPCRIFEVKDGEDVTVPAGWYFFKSEQALMDGCARHKTCRHNRCKHRGKEPTDLNERERYKLALWV